MNNEDRLHFSYLFSPFNYVRIYTGSVSELYVCHLRRMLCFPFFVEYSSFIVSFQRWQRLLFGYTAKLGQKGGINKRRWI